MERTLEVACEGTASSFTGRKLSRATLYGTRRRVPVDAEGRPCRAAALTRDGRFLLPRGTTATLYLDDQGDTIERGELRPMRDRQDAGAVPEPQAAEATDLLDCVVRQVYALAPVAVSGRLDELLAATGVCRLDSGDEGEVRFLVKNAAGYFLLGGASTRCRGPERGDGDGGHDCLSSRGQVHRLRDMRPPPHMSSPRPLPPLRRHHRDHRPQLRLKGKPRQNPEDTCGEAKGTV